MFLFQQLELAGLNQENIQTLTTEDLIPIEKKLLAESRLNNTISRNDIDALLSILKIHLEEVKTLARSEFFYSFFSGKDPGRSSKFIVKTAGQTERMKTFLYDYLREDILNYLNQNTSRNLWSKVTLLLKYRKFIDQRVLQQYIYILEEKTHFANEVLETHPTEEELNRAVPFVKEAHFYNVLSTLDFNHFDNDILSLVVNAKRHPQFLEFDFFYHMQNAVKGYKPTDPRFNPNAEVRISHPVSYGGGEISVGRMIFLIILVIRLLLLLLG